MDNILKYRRLIFLTLCLTPIVLRKTDLIGNWTTFFLALIPISIIILLANLDIEPGVAFDFGEPEIKTKKGLFYFINKTGKFGQLIMYTLLGSVVLLPLGIPSGIVVFIPFFISAFMIMIL